MVLLDRGKVVLAGASDGLRESGWEGQQDIVFRGNDLKFTNALGALAHLEGISEGRQEGTRTASIRLRDVSKPAEVLSVLSDQVEVLEFVKVRPTMESLFIKAVAETAKDHGQE